MTTAALTLRRPAGRPGALGLGISTLWLSLIVLLPLAAVVVRSTEGGFDTFWNAVTSRQSIAALRFTIEVSLLCTLINAVSGTLIAWVLVRDQFRGKKFVNALIDLPFALPTIVAGLTLLALYGPNSPVGIDVAFTKTAVLMALLFVTLPFVIRAVQPVLIELDREMEEAAVSLGANSRTVFLRVILPNLVPAILSGVGARLRPRGRRVRLDRAHLRQHPVRHPGRVDVHLQEHRERQPDRRGRRLGGAAGALAGDPDRDPRPRTLGGAP